MKTCKLLLSLWILAGLCSRAPVAAQEASFRLAPSDMRVSTNWQFTTELHFSVTNTPMGACSLVLSFDPSVVCLLEAKPMPGTWFPADLELAMAGADLGYVPIAMTRTGTANPAGDHLILCLRWLSAGMPGDCAAIEAHVESALDFWWQPLPFTVSNATVTVDIQDDDADGLPNWWEVLVSGNPTGVVAAADLDLDGVVNGEEYRAGTDPLQMLSKPVLHLAGEDGGAMHISCEGNRARYYRFQSCTNLGQPEWQDMAAFVPESDGTIWLSNLAEYMAPPCFYRYDVRLPMGVSGPFPARTNRFWTTEAPTDFSALQPALYRLYPSNTYTLTRLEVLSSNLFTFSFDLSHAGANPSNRWAGAMLYFNNAPFDFSSNAMVLGLQAEGTARVKLEVEDHYKEKAAVWLDTIGRSTHNYQVSASDLGMLTTGTLAWAQVRSVAVVVDELLAGWSAARGRVQVHTQGVPVSTDPPLIEGALYDTNVLTRFGTYNLVATGKGGNVFENCPEGFISWTQHCAEAIIEYDYNVGQDSFSYAYLQIARPGALTFPLLTNAFVFAAWGTRDDRVRVDLADRNGNVVTARITLAPEPQNYTIEWAPAELERFFMRSIVFANDWSIGSPALTNKVFLQIRNVLCL